MSRSAPSIDQTPSVACPMCGSSHCQLQSIATKAGAVVGAVLGAIIAAGLRIDPVSADNGSALVSVVSRQFPVTITGNIGRALAGFARGAVAGYAAGAAVDEKVIVAYLCLSCGLKF